MDFTLDHPRHGKYRWDAPGRKLTLARSAGGQGGRFELYGTGTYSGGTILNGTNVEICVYNANAFGSGPVTIDGSMFMNKAEMTITNAIVIGQNSQAANPGSFDFSAGNLTFSGDISGSGATFVKNVDNTKTMTLSGNNSGFTGIWSASKGTLRFASPDAGSPNGTWIMGHNGAVLDFGGGTIHLGALSSSTEWAKILPAVNSGDYTIVVGEKNVDSTFTAQINQGTGNSIGLEKRGTAVQTLANAVSSYRGGTTVKGGILSAMIIADDWVNSSIGQTGSLVLDGGTLQYIGVGNSSNRRITLGLAGGGLDASGTGAIIMSNAGMTLTPGGARTLTLSGSSTSTNLLKTVVANDGANPTSFRKTGTGTWLA